MNHHKYCFDGITTRKILVFMVSYSLFIFAIFLSINNSSNDVFAVDDKLPNISDINLSDLNDGNGNFIDLKHAVATAPDGLPLKDYFQLGEFPSNELTNTAKVISHGNQVYTDSSLLLVNNSIKQLGAIWGNFDKDNYFDTNLFQTMSMWVYLGYSLKYDGRNQYKPHLEPGQQQFVGDGMSLVFHNDSRKLGAISTFKSNKEGVRLGNGESMGVWGTDFDNDVHLPWANDDHHLEKDIAKTAIQNSLALEFDTFVDGSTDFASLNNLGISFDAGKQGQHIALNYPADPWTYQANLVSGTGNDQGNYKKYFKMLHHYQNDNQYLSDGNWHHVTIKWNPITKQMRYFFDDRDKDGNIKYATAQATAPIDISKFGFKDANHKLHWGFTGSTGKFSENNLIVFESIPSFVNAELNMQIFDKSTGELVGEKLENSEQKSPVRTHANAGDTLDFTYALNYQSGIKNWDKITANINLPSEVEYRSAYVDYNDGAPVEKVENDPMTGNKFTYHLAKSLTPTHNKATVHIITRVKPVAGKVFVKEQHAKFEGDYLIKDGMSPDFVIGFNILNMRVDPEQINYQGMSEVTSDPLINCYVWNNTSNNDLSDVSLNVTLNGKPLPDQKLTDGTSYYVPTPITIPKDRLHEGQNTVVIKTEELVGRQTFTSEKTVFITIGGNVTISYRTQNVRFATINGNSVHKLVGRSGMWKVDVTDTRKKGAGWRVNAVAMPLINTKTKLPFNGKMVFIDKNNNYHSLSKPVEVDRATKATDDPKTWDIVERWQKNQGIQLLTNDPVEEGYYHGTIIWQLIDSVK
ncbi:lectin-like domain-containing protein [Companilactobacillus furfuricola]|uniref:lectin-like domain-containing protein n=1 Tax=Companilactobacillus furfuricola TaxID=1462575 RepID=UPI000F785639|nr:hypothetical protein [Companilactobacillus furfuricola]